MKKYVVISLFSLFAACPLFASTNFNVSVSVGASWHSRSEQVQHHYRCQAPRHYNVYNHYPRVCHMYSPVIYVMRPAPVIVERVCIRPAPRVYIIEEYP